MRRPALLVVLALGNIFAGDQDDHVTSRPPYRLRIFANPENRAVLAYFSDLPAMRPAEFFCAACQFSFHKFSVLLEKYVQHRLSNQLRGCIPELRGAKAVHRQHCPGWTDHEIHDRVVLKYLAPLLLALSQRVSDAVVLGNEKGCQSDYCGTDRCFQADAASICVGQTGQEEG